VLQVSVGPPRGLNATVITFPVCSVSVLGAWSGLAESHSRAVTSANVSALAVAMMPLPRVNAVAYGAPSWPRNAAIGVGVLSGR
jgi:hypothetical protein